MCEILEYQKEKLNLLGERIGVYFFSTNKAKTIIMPQRVHNVFE